MTAQVACSLPAAVVPLDHALAMLAAALTDARVAVVEDHPPGEAKLIDDLDERLTDAIGTLDAARQYLRSTGVSAADQVATCHEHFLAVTAIVRRDVTGPRPHDEIRRLAAQRGAVWRGWAAIVSTALAEIEPPLERAEIELLHTWRHAAKFPIPARAATSPDKG